jgi:hypothetical protein
MESWPAVAFVSGYTVELTAKLVFGLGFSLADVLFSQASSVIQIA